MPLNGFEARGAHRDPVAPTQSELLEYISPGLEVQLRGSRRRRLSQSARRLGATSHVLSETLPGSSGLPNSP